VSAQRRALLESQRRRRETLAETRNMSTETAFLRNNDQALRVGRLLTTTLEESWSENLTTSLNMSERYNLITILVFRSYFVSFLMSWVTLVGLAYRTIYFNWGFITNVSFCHLSEDKLILWQKSLRFVFELVNGWLVCLFNGRNSVLPIVQVSLWARKCRVPKPIWTLLTSWW
jgi:hypothetical protein